MRTIKNSVDFWFCAFQVFIYLFLSFLSGKNAVFEVAGCIEKKFIKIYLVEDFFWVLYYENLALYFWKHLPNSDLLSLPPAIGANMTLGSFGDRLGIGQKLLLVPCWWLWRKGTDPAKAPGQCNPRISLLMDIGNHTQIPYFLHGKATIHFCVILSRVLRI